MKQRKYSVSPLSTLVEGSQWQKLVVERDKFAMENQCHLNIKMSQTIKSLPWYLAHNNHTLSSMKRNTLLVLSKLVLTVNPFFCSLLIEQLFLQFRQLIQYSYNVIPVILVLNAKNTVKNNFSKFIYKINW